MKYFGLMAVLVAALTGCASTMSGWQTAGDDPSKVWIEVNDLSWVRFDNADSSTNKVEITVTGSVQEGDVLCLCTPEQDDPRQGIVGLILEQEEGRLGVFVGHGINGKGKVVDHGGRTHAFLARPGFWGAKAFSRLPASGKGWLHGGSITENKPGVVTSRIMCLLFLSRNQDEYAAHLPHNAGAPATRVGFDGLYAADNRIRQVTAGAAPQQVAQTGAFGQ